MRNFLHGYFWSHWGGIPECASICSHKAWDLKFTHPRSLDKSLPRAGSLWTFFLSAERHFHLSVCLLFHLLMSGAYKSFYSMRRENKEIYRGRVDEKHILFCKIKKKSGEPGLLSGWASAFGTGHDSSVLGSSPALGALQGACFSLCLCLRLPLCVSRK